MNPADIAKEVVRIANTHRLAKDAIDLMEKKLASLTEKAVTLERENTQLKLENALLRQHLQHPQPVKDLPSPRGYRIPPKGRYPRQQER